LSILLSFVEKEAQLSSMNGNEAQKVVLTPRQVRTLDELLAIGAERPAADPNLVSEITARLEAAVAPALERWTERSLYLTKGQYLSVRRCEGELLANARAPRSGLSSAMVAGTIAHRAVQLSYTHPFRPVSEYVRQSVVGARSADTSLDAWWAQLPLGEQSDLLMQITSKVTNFLDDFPPLDPNWSPRFEEPMVAKIGKLTLASRADLLIGRPRGDLRQTMLLIDLKSGDIKDEHQEEAQFYALVATVRHGVPPWRSLVYSLASGEYTRPDVSGEILLETAERVGAAVNALVDVLTERRTPDLRPGSHCRWCPAKTTCSVAQV
jgi:hypothetical protein